MIFLKGNKYTFEWGVINFKGTFIIYKLTMVTKSL